MAGSIFNLFNNNGTKVPNNEAKIMTVMSAKETVKANSVELLNNKL